MTLKIEFDTTGYEASHGHKPTGRGGWAFSEKRNPDVMTSDVIWAPNGLTLTEAKRWLKQKLQSEGVEGFFVVHVLP